MARLLVFMRPDRRGEGNPSGNAAGSNRIVVKPASGGASQRCALEGGVGLIENPALKAGTSRYDDK
jgi:hypothetical protein